MYQLENEVNEASKLRWPRASRFAFSPCGRPRHAPAGLPPKMGWHVIALDHDGQSMGHVAADSAIEVLAKLKQKNGERDGNSDSA